MNGDAGARERLVELYLPLVAGIARRYARRGDQYDDLVQVGSIGLIKAIDRFDLSRGEEFAAYAVPNIVGEIKRHLRDSGTTVRLPRALAELRGRVPGAREALTARLGREPSPAELAVELHVEESMVSRVLAAERPGAPTGSPDDVEPFELDNAFLGTDERLALADAFGDLDERERRVVYLRFVRDLGPEQVARELGISRRTLSRQTQAALRKLRVNLEAAPGAGPGRLPQQPTRPNMRQVKSVATREGQEYVDRPYHIVLVKEAGDDGAWIAQVEELPGCEARADTPDEATVAIRESMEAWFADALAHEREIPEPRGASTHSGRLMLRMPQSLHAELARAAERDEVSLNQFITGSLAGAVGWRQHAGDGDAAQRGDDEPEPSPKRLSGRWLGKAMVANAVLLALAGVAAVTLLVIVLIQAS